MKKTIFFLYIILIGIQVYSQNEKTEYIQKVDSGYVFIDGRYIEAPYFFEIKNNALYVNNNPITIQYKEVKKPEKLIIDKEPKMPSNISKWAGLTALDTLKDENGFNVNNLMTNYLWQHYDSATFIKKRIEFYQSLPFLKKVDRIDNLNIKVEDFYGKTAYIGLFPNRIPDENTTDNISDGLIMQSKRIIKLLENNLFFFTNSRGSIEIYLEEEKGMTIIDLLKNKNNFRIITSEELFNISSTVRDSLVINYVDNDQLSNRRNSFEKKKKTDTERDNISEKFLDNKKSKISTKSIIENQTSPAYSPSGNEIIIYFPNYGQFNLPSVPESHINTFIDNLSPLGYTSIAPKIFKDVNVLDNNPDGCTLENFKSCNSASILDLFGHGNWPTDYSYFPAVYLNNETDALDWMEYGTGMIQINTTLEWPDGTIQATWTVLVPSLWATHNFKNNLDAKKSIVFINSCHSAIEDPFGNCWAKDCGGGVSFGWSSLQNISVSNPIIESILSKMGGTYRTARKAYDNTTISPDRGFNIIEYGSDITLCPAIREISPTNGSSVGGSGTGYIEFDTYMHPVTATSSLSYATTGLVTISNIRWNSTSLPNKILYDWAATGDFSVTLTIAPDKFQSYHFGNFLGQNLDFTVGDGSNLEVGTISFSGDFAGVPTNVQASNQYNDKVSITWNSVSDATHYKVFRNTSDNSSTSNSISNWITNFTFDDLTASAGVTYYYWVKAAKSTSGTGESQFSSSATGMIYSPCGVSFSYEQGENNSGSYKVDFASSTTGDIISWNWNFGDSNCSTNDNTSTDPNPSHYYANTGSYEILLKVMNSDYIECTQSKTITVLNNSGSFDIYLSALPSYAIIGQTILLVGEVEFNNGTPPFKYTFNVGQGPPLVYENIDSRSLFSEPFSYVSTGTYVVNLSVIDALGIESNASVPIDIYYAEEYPQVCYIRDTKIEYNGCSTIPIGGTISILEKATPLKCIEMTKWWWISGGREENYLEYNGYRQIVTHTYTSKGVKTIKSTIYEKNGGEYDRWAGAIVVDCNETVSAANLSPAVYYDAGTTDWYFSGNYDLTSLDQGFSNKKTYITACNNVILRPGVNIKPTTDNYLIIRNDKVCLGGGNLKSTMDVYKPQNEKIIDEKSSFMVYPNPVNNTFFVDFNNVNKEVKVIELYNSLGQLILNKIPENNLVEFNVQENPSGLYMLKVVYYDNSFEFGKIIISR